MSVLVWDKVGERFYETGVDHVVLYKMLDEIPNNATTPYGAGVARNGVTNISESASGGEPSPLFADNIKYLNLISTETAALSIGAYTYPEEFEECDGTREVATGVIARQQPRKQFGLSYRTRIGNDQQADDYGYKLHLVYGCYASPSERAYNTVNESPEAIGFSWSVTTTPVELSNYKPTAILTINSKKVPPAKLTALENLLYGTENANATLPLPDTVVTTIGTNNG